MSNIKNDSAQSNTVNNSSAFFKPAEKVMDVIRYKSTAGDVTTVPVKDLGKIMEDFFNHPQP